MYSLSLSFKQKTKKLTIPKSLNSTDFYTLITQSFNLKQKVIGLTNSKGQLLNYQQLRKSSSIYQKELLYLITTLDVNDDNMSFASDHHGQYKKDYLKKDQIPQITIETNSPIPQKLEGFYQGVIGDLQLFQKLFLLQQGLTVVFCFIKQKPKNFQYPYYLYHTSKNSTIVYSGSQRICQFFIDFTQKIPKSIESFILSLTSEQKISKIAVQKPFHKKSKEFSSKISSKVSLDQIPINDKLKQSNGQILFDSEEKLEDQNYNEDDQSDDEHLPNAQQQQNHENQSYLESEQESARPQTQQQKTEILLKLIKLRDDGQLNELQFYKMKSELLQSFSDFLRKYQMGTRKGFRRQRNQQILQDELQRLSNTNKAIRKSYKNDKVQKPQKLYHQQQKYQKQEKVFSINSRTPQSKGAGRFYSREQRRNKKYQIPIIVRKYNNVIQKISTSYPLTQQQQQSINLILQLQLKGLISQKQSGVYKTSILQEDTDVFPLFLDYFDNLIDQLELVSKIKKIKKINSEKKQRSQHNMRLLIKHAKQGSYELLRTLLLEKNNLVLASFEKFRNDKNSQRLAARLQKIAAVQRQKDQLQQDVYD